MDGSAPCQRAYSAYDQIPQDKGLFEEKNFGQSLVVRGCSIIQKYGMRCPDHSFPFCIYFKRNLMSYKIFYAGYTGLHKLWYPVVQDMSTWSKFGAHGERGDVFLFSNLVAL